MRLICSLSFCCFFTLTSFGFANTLRPFTSDGCSVFIDGNLDNTTLWLDCCIAHDMAYWRGGTYKQRKQADAELKSCVETKGEKVIAEIMEAGVRVGGSPFFPTSYRWGYGWESLRGYFELSPEEIEEADRLLEQYRQGENIR